MKILIVDDSALLHERLRTSILKLDSHIELCHAYGMTDARNSISAFHPDLAILDISLPDGSGIYLIPELKSHFPEMKIMMMTNYSNNEITRKCFQLGADEFFDKKDLIRLLDCVLHAKT